MQISLENDAAPVAEQLWSTVRDVISYSSNLMSTFMRSLGVCETHLSPFCREFASTKDLMDEFIKYCPKTFKYNGVHGNGVPDEVVDGSVETEFAPEETLVDRLNQFSVDLFEQSDANDVTVFHKDKMSTTNANTQDHPIPDVSVDASLTAASLIAEVTALLECNSSDMLFEAVLGASAVLESRDKRAEGSINIDRKAKSLLSWWYSSSATAKSNVVDDSISVNETWVQRDSLVSVNVTSGRGNTKTTKPFQYRVLGLYDKSYNKWFMSSVRRRWDQSLSADEKKKYKVSVRMISMNAVGQYQDVPIDESCEFKIKDICRVVDGSMILSVGGNLLLG